MTIVGFVRRVPRIAWVVGGFVVWLCVSALLAEKVVAQRDTILDLEASRDALAERSMDLTALEARVKSSAAISEQTSGLMREADEATASTRLRTMVTQLCERQGFLVAAMRSVPSTAEEGLLVTGLSLNARGDPAKLQALLSSFDLASPALFVDDLAAVTAEVAARLGSKDESVNISLSVRALVLLPPKVRSSR